MLDKMALRRSVVANALAEPGPSEDELAQILKIGARVPDHGKLEPWRFVIFRDEARQEFGAELARIYKMNDSDAGEERLELEGARFLRAPVVVCVVSSLKESPKIPEWEQRLSSGAVCQNILLASSALGFSAQWITEWYAYDEAVGVLLGLRPGEQVAGFIYIGSAKEPPQERARPDMGKIVHHWKK